MFAQWVALCKAPIFWPLILTNASIARSAYLNALSMRSMQRKTFPLTKGTCHFAWRSARVNSHWGSHQCSAAKPQLISNPTPAHSPNTCITLRCLPISSHAAKAVSAMAL